MQRCKVESNVVALFRQGWFLPEWMRFSASRGRSSSLSFEPMSEHEDIWHVQLESGEVRQLTLDQLDAFFNNGIIDEDTYVLADGEMEWRTLRVVLGLEEESAAPAPVVPAAVFAPANPFAPTLQVTPTPAPVSYGAVPPYPRESAAPGELYSPSIRPVVSEIDPGELDFDDAMFKKSSKAKWIVSGGVVAAVAAWPSAWARAAWARSTRPTCRPPW